MTFKQWDEMTVLEQYECIYSDMHKDAFGVRPRNDTSSWTEQMFEAEFDTLKKIIEQNYISERAGEAAAVLAHQVLIQNLIQSGAKDRQTALRWSVQDEKFVHGPDIEHYVWGLGILFTDYGRKLVEELEQLQEQVA